MRNITAIGLDLDDTLWDVADVIGRAEREFRAWLSERYAYLAAEFERSKMLATRNLVLADFPDKAHDLSFLRIEVYRRLGEAGGAPTGFADEAFAVFDHWRNQVELYAGAKAALEKLADRYPVIAITNGNADVGRIGLGDYFCGSVTARRAGVAKPHAGIFQMAAAELNKPIASIMHIGDDPEADVLGALGAGMMAGWINRSEHQWSRTEPSPDLAGRDLTAITMLIFDKDLGCD